MFSACFSAPACLRVKKHPPPLDAIPTRTEQSASRYVQNMSTSISPLFNHFQIRKAEIARLPCYTGSVGAGSCTIHWRAPPRPPRQDPATGGLTGRSVWTGGAVPLDPVPSGGDVLVRLLAGRPGGRPW